MFRCCIMLTRPMLVHAITLAVAQMESKSLPRLSTHLGTDEGGNSTASGPSVTSSSASAHTMNVICQPDHAQMRVTLGHALSACPD